MTRATNIIYTAAIIGWHATRRNHARIFVFSHSGFSSEQGSPWSLVALLHQLMPVVYLAGYTLCGARPRRFEHIPFNRLRATTYTA